jgi:hypothetical protein
MKTRILAAAVALAVCLPLNAADESGKGKIAWHGTWEGGLAVAQKTGRPILLISAAPHCHGTPGIW